MIYIYIYIQFAKLTCSRGTWDEPVTSLQGQVQARSPGFHPVQTRIRIQSNPLQPTDSTLLSILSYHVYVETGQQTQFEKYVAISMLQVSQLKSTLARASPCRRRIKS